MTKVTVTISYNAMNSQSEDLSLQEIQETVEGLTNSLRTQVNDVHVHVETSNEEN